jgi:hypothetical protein
VLSSMNCASTSEILSGVSVTDLVNSCLSTWTS